MFDPFKQRDVPPLPTTRLYRRRAEWSSGGLLQWAGWSPGGYRQDAPEAAREVLKYPWTPSQIATVTRMEVECGATGERIIFSREEAGPWL